MNKYVEYEDEKIPIEKALERMDEEIGELQEEIDKLTAESTDWKERTYYWQDRAVNFQIVLNKIKRYIENDILDINEEVGIGQMIYDKLNELLEGIE